ncbi:phage tail protein [Roseibacterium sp. SDUM158017]|uniref:phage tail protein n=1 Tax=Roseicyclus salinarum TaxID=3036773 RepID=UPI002414E9D0|nr:phage tail protein [Roseibacterium sp. SDUM158017]MDG4650124.1 phage tail protein [Roseibacterium sp. SDUM158017]
MSQVTSLSRANGTGIAVREGFNNLIGALFSQNSGSTAPTATVPYMLWADTSTSPATLRMRNAADDAWIALGTVAEGFGVETIPAGMFAPFAMQTPPTGWLECDGSALSRTTYADLFAAIGVVWGSGDGSTTFNVPDLRGEFLRGWDNGRGVDSARAFGSFQAEDTNNVRDFFTSATGTAAGTTGTKTIPQDGSYSDYGISGRGSSNEFWNFRMRHTGDETRPRNRAVMFCIKF